MGVIDTLSQTLYNSYEKKLLRDILSRSVPKHIGIIMDGNRRFALDLGIDPIVGHAMGKDKLREVLYWCRDVGVKYLTVYAFSTENLRRPSKELNALMNMFTQSFYELGDDKEVHQYRIRARAIGQLELLPNEVRTAIKYAEEKTKDYNDFFFNVAIAYGGREEILQAIKKIATHAKAGKVEVKNIDEKLFSSYLYTADLPDPDLILRTSGEERVSNFLLWQLAYSELFFSDVYWPAFRKVDFLRTIRDYQRRARRYGT
jgi:tritrans,polycis-undecaprenyl-diphosphate synthase [geranylgeranyl-diphosphate specific]